jgi:copper homeostasis protein
MRKDIEFCRQSGLDGVVLGILLPDARLDRDRCGELVQLAKPMSVTLHRAFDMTADPLQALEDAIEAGFQRILTSGQANSAIEGRGLIAELVRRAGERIVIVAGAGVNAENLAKLVESTEVREFHTSARAIVPSQMLFRNPRVSLGGDSKNEYELLTVDPNTIERMREVAKQLTL